VFVMSTISFDCNSFYYMSDAIANVGSDFNNCVDMPCVCVMCS